MTTECITWKCLFDSQQAIMTLPGDRNDYSSLNVLCGGDGDTEKQM